MLRVASSLRQTDGPAGLQQDVARPDVGRLCVIDGANDDEQRQPRQSRVRAKARREAPARPLVAFEAVDEHDLRGAPR